jgi:hypothetical protein
MHEWIEIMAQNGLLAKKREKSFVSEAAGLLTSHFKLTAVYAVIARNERITQIVNGVLEKRKQFCIVDKLPTVFTKIDIVCFLVRKEALRDQQDVNMIARASKTRDQHVHRDCTGSQSGSWNDSLDASCTLPGSWFHYPFRSNRQS